MTQSSRISPVWPVLWILLVTAIVLFAVLFAQANNHWVQLFLPAVPWSQTRIAGGFESQLWVVMLLCLLCGGLVVSPIYRYFVKASHRKQQHLVLRISELDKELERLRRLMTLKKDKQVES